MSTDLAVVDTPAPAAPLATRDRGFLSSQDVLARTTRILEIQKAVMKEGVHFGTIPGTPKPTLYKPGAEKLLLTFQIAAIPGVVEDLSTADEVRYRVRVQGVSQVSGAVLGEAVGECSSNEEKYRWRKPVCDEEWDETPEDLRRAVWKKYQGRASKVKQVRTSPADVANTILQMAQKRGLIPMTRTVLACSDIFAQDLEDMPAELRESILEQDEPQTVPPVAPPAKPTAAPSATASAPTPAAAPTPPPPAPRQAGEDVISDRQAKRFYAIARGAGWSDQDLKDWLQARIGTPDDRQIPRRLYDKLCADIAAGVD